MLLGRTLSVLHSLKNSLTMAFGCWQRPSWHAKHLCHCNSRHKFAEWPYSVSHVLTLQLLQGLSTGPCTTAQPTFTGYPTKRSLQQKNTFIKARQNPAKNFEPASLPQFSASP